MGNANEFHSKDADFHFFARLNAMEQSVADQVMLFQLALSQSGGKVGTVNRDIEFLQQVWQCSKMVFVSVSEDYCSDTVTILFEEIEVGNTNVNPVSCLFGKTHAGVEDKHLVLVAHSHAIHPKLADAAERNDL